MKHWNGIRKSSLLLTFLLLFSAILTSCSNRVSNQLDTPPGYEAEFNDDSYYNYTYILIKNTLVFHRYDCYTVDRMSEKPYGCFHY